MLLALLTGLSMAAPPDTARVDSVLDALHRAATEADAATYFSLFADDGVFIGTDPTERWDLPSFRQFAEPHFAEAPAWAYSPRSREVHLGPKGRTAWFYETLEHARYGEVRGSGALRLDGGDWRITQYVLSFPIPNEHAGAVLDVVAGRATLPSPYTAAQIRDAYEPGFYTVYRHADGGHESRRRTTVVSATPDQVTLRFETLDTAGAVVGEPSTSTATWVELRDHASFPAGTEHSPEASVQVPFGSLDVRRYTVRSPDGTTKTFWFAPALPGPPVLMTVARDDVEVLRMELIERVGD